MGKVSTIEVKDRRLRLSRVFKPRFLPSLQPYRPYQFYSKTSLPLFNRTHVDLYNKNVRELELKRRGKKSTRKIKPRM